MTFFGSPTHRKVRRMSGIRSIISDGIVTLFFGLTHIDECGDGGQTTHRPLSDEWVRRRRLNV
jgi:hypothetical protein